MVSGGLAVIKSMFRDNLSNEELVQRLFTTARDDGIYADAAIYGHGLMDLGAATNPWGIPAFMSSLSSTSSAPLSTSFVSQGAPMGNSLTRAMQNQEVAAFDSLGAPFWFQGSDFTLPPTGSSTTALLQRFTRPVPPISVPATWEFDVQEAAVAVETGHLALTDGASRFTMNGPQGLGASLFHEAGAMEGLTVSWTPSPSLTFAAGYLNELQSLLGSQAGGAFGRLSGETLFLSAGLNTTSGGWQLAAAGELGQVRPAVASSQFITDVSPLSTSAFRLQATRPFANGAALRVSLSQPLRVESGAAALSLPTGRTRDGVVLRKALSAPLVPRGRQLDLAARLAVPLAGGDLSMGATWSHQPRHQRNAPGEWTLFSGYHATW